MKTKLFLTAALTCLGVISGAWAAGNGTSGGGDVLILDDRVVLADFAVQKVGARIQKFDDALYSELWRISKFFGLYGTSVDFVGQEILNPLIDYYLVDQIPPLKECESRVPVTLPSDGTRIEQVACTVGATTWIREDLFKKLSLRGQALLLVHERLRGYAAPLSHEQIVDIVVGLDVVLALHNDQLRGDLRHLTPEEKNTIEEMRRRFALIFPKSKTQFAELRITEHGGGMYFGEAHISPSAYIDLDSRIGTENRPYAEVQEGVVVLNSTIRWTYLGKGSIVKNSDLDLLETGANVTIENVFSLDPYNKASGRIGSNSKIVNSRFGLAFTAKEDSTIEGVHASSGIHVGTRSKLKNVEFKDTGHRVGDDVTISDVYFKGLNHFIFDMIGDGAELRGLRISLRGKKSFFFGKDPSFEILPYARLDGMGGSICGTPTTAPSTKVDQLEFKNEARIANLQDLQELCKD